jgi:ESCRT-I complex subunit TSG101
MTELKKKVEYLSNQLSCYKDKHRVLQDIVYCLTYVPSLSPQISTLSKIFNNIFLVHQNGKGSTILNLIGTIPMYFKNQKFLIPISIWIVELYPFHPPICYVTPTKG